MPIESATYISQLNPSYPTGAETKAEGDNQIRMFKGAVQNSFPNVSGAVTVTHSELNSVTSRVLITGGSTLTGTHDYSGATSHLVPNVTAGDSTTKSANTAFVQAAIAGVNSQTALTVAVNSTTSVSASVGQHVICTNAALTTVTLPATSSAGDRVKVTFANSLVTNLINPNGGKIFGSTSNHTANAYRAAVEFVASGDSATGWTY